MRQQSETSQSPDVEIRQIWGPTPAFNEPWGRLTSTGSMSLAMEGERERDLRWDLGSSSRDGVLEGVKFSMEST